MAEGSQETGLPPQEVVTQPKQETSKNWLSKFLDKLTPHSQADAIAGTTAARVMPEASAALAADIAKTEQTPSAQTAVSSATK